MLNQIKNQSSTLKLGLRRGPYVQDFAAVCFCCGLQGLQACTVGSYLNESHLMTHSPSVLREYAGESLPALYEDHGANELIKGEN